MATLTLTVTLDASHRDDDELVLLMGNAPGVSLADSTPAGGVELTREPVGDAAGTTDAVTLVGDVADFVSCAVYSVGVAVVDAAGNVSSLWETFDRVADHPDGVDLAAPAGTGQSNEARLTWSRSGSFDV